MKTVAALALVVLAAPAGAQSKRYPPEPVDKDREAAEHSKLWEAATNPHKTTYEALLAEAQQLIDGRTDDQAIEAVHKLDQAVALLPDEPDAYRLRGEAYMALDEWAKCARDLETAAAKTTPSDTDAARKPLADRRRKLGLCQARAGKLGDAERTLSEAAASGTANGELLMRLGEVRIAMGKLEEAISALRSSLDATDSPMAQAPIRWLLASAYDRARLPAEALDEARRAAGLDRSGTAIQGLQLLAIGEQEYLMGLSYTVYEPPRPEYVLLYFRRFLTLAPDSPWRKRAEDHLREVKPAELPEVVNRIAGAAPLDLDAARAVVRRSMPAMRACMTKVPNGILEVTITKVGPRTPPSDRGRPRYLAPPEGVNVELRLNLDVVSRAETDAAIRCVEPIAAKLPMPPIKERDAYYKAAFFVVGS